MYHTNKLNQEKYFNKTLSITKISQKDLHTDHYRSDIASYLATCTPSEQNIAHFLLNYRYASTTKITNAFIATKIGCSIITVIRTTNKFHKDGFITKHQQNRYAPNYFTFNDKITKGKYAFDYWLNSLSPNHRDLYISHGIKVNHKNRIVCQFEYDIHNNNLLLINSLSRRVCVSSRARRPNTFKKRMIMNAVQKQLILNNRHDPKIKDVLNSPTIKGNIITPTIEKISTLLSLDKPEQFKLIPFREDVLLFVVSEIETIITRKDTPRITNRMQWLVALATNHSKTNNIKIDWSWYYDLCEILGIPTKVDKKPLVFKKDRVAVAASYKPKASQWDSMLHYPLDVRIETLQAELKKNQELLANCTGPDPFHLKGILVRTIANVKEELSEAQLEKECDEKQELPNQYNTNIMESYCAAS